MTVPISQLKTLRLQDVSDLPRSHSQACALGLYFPVSLEAGEFLGLSFPICEVRAFLPGCSGLRGLLASE